MTDDRPVAVCPRCTSVVVSTMHFAGAEWYCLDCGAPIAYLDAVPATPTIERVAEMRTVEAEWMTNAGPRLLTPRSRRVDCHKCASRREDHDRHASRLEVELHEQAVEWMAARRRVGWEATA